MASNAKTGTRNKKRHEHEPDASFSSIIAIGSSAGGLEALTRFFSRLPKETGLAFVVITHLDPDHKTMLPELIRRASSIPALEITDGLELAADRVHIIAPNKSLALHRHTLHLLPRQKHDGYHRAVDLFFRELAKEQGTRAVGIILSGSGSDGSEGVMAIKAAGGLVLAQDPDSAKFSEMPKNAAATGAVDHIMPPEEMAEQLLPLIREHQLSAGTHLADSDGRAAEAALQKIFALIRSVTGHDFSQYKRNTIHRRIERRMFVHKLDNIDQYIDYLSESEREVSELFREMLIGVTSFFRDPETFDMLKETYLPKLLEEKKPGDRVRIWVPGCSSGEEVYSLAIVVQECLDALNLELSVQLFGTDLDEEAIKTARAGLYPATIAEDVSRERLDKYFSSEDGSYRIKKGIREMVVFAEQNVTKDPPFTRLDLLCCRNLLIYFGPELQERLMPTFHYSLRAGGILVLGTSESLGRYAEHFTQLEQKWKIFQRRPDHGSLKRHGELQLPAQLDSDTLHPEPIPLKPAGEEASRRLLRAILAGSDLPASVVVNDKAELVYTHGRTGRYLEPAEGEASNNILKMARPDLKQALTNVIHKMASERSEMVVRNIRVRTNGTSQDIDLIVRPLPDTHSGHRGLILVIFDDSAEHRQARSGSADEDIETSSNSELKRIKEELRYTRENLKATIEELETSNEELKSTNEELQSANEELQSTNEELETSQEELQSVNEEASTVNSELQSRIDELVSANDDIKNLLDATDIAIIFLDIDLNIRRFTPMISRLFHLKPTDIGRSIGHFASTLKGIDMAALAEQVLETLDRHESVVEDRDGSRYRMRLRPFRTVNNVTEGIVVTFDNVTEFKKMVDALAESKALWHKLVENAPQGIFVITDAQFVYANPAGVKLFGSPSTKDLLGTPVAKRFVKTERPDLTERLTALDTDRLPLPLSTETCLRLDNTPIPCHILAAPVIYKEKQSAVLYVSMTDTDELARQQ